MPPLETSDLHQKAVLWPFLNYDRFGQPVVSDDHEEIPVRWEWGHREMLDSKGNTIGVDAVVVVDRRITLGSNLWLGESQDVPAGTSFTSERNELCQVIFYSEIPDIKGREVRRLVGLIRLKSYSNQTSSNY